MKYKVKLLDKRHTCRGYIEESVEAISPTEAKRIASARYAGSGYRASEYGPLEVREPQPTRSSSYRPNSSAAGIGLVAVGAALWANRKAHKAQEAQEAEQRRYDAQVRYSEEMEERALRRAEQERWEAANRHLWEEAVKDLPNMDPADAIFARITHPDRSFSIKFLRELNPSWTWQEAHERFSAAEKKFNYREAISPGGLTEPSIYSNGVLNIENAADVILKKYLDADPDIAAMTIAGWAAHDAVPLPIDAPDWGEKLDKRQSDIASKTEELLPKIKETFLQEQRQLRWSRRFAKIRKFLLWLTIILVTIVTVIYGGWQLVKMAYHSEALSSHYRFTDVITVPEVRKAIPAKSGKLQIRKAIPVESASAQVRKAIPIQHKVANRDGRPSR